MEVVKISRSDEDYEVSTVQVQQDTDKDLALRVLRELANDITVKPETRLQAVNTMLTWRERGML